MFSSSTLNASHAMKQILQNYLKRLTNLSGSNRSLVLLRTKSEQTIDLHKFNHSVGENSFHYISSLIAGQGSRLCAIADSRDAESNKLSMRLRNLNRVLAYIKEESGVNDLYVGWPFVRGKFHDGTIIRCPLMFFPVSVAQNTTHWLLNPRKDVNITLNKTFLLAYSYYNKVNLDEELIERVFETHDKDSRIFRTELYRLFKDSPIELNFNQENFIDNLQAFEQFKKKDFVAGHHEGELKLFPEAVLGIFPQAGSHLVPDYMHMIEEDTVHDIDHFFDERVIDKVTQDDTPADPRQLFRFLNQIKEEDTYAAFKLDAWQENALKAIKKNNSLVVQGPPGTGKSQLICNLITDYAARGKKVLVVCQKKAALDVIIQRLKEVDFQDFAAQVSDFKNDRKSVYEQIDRQIESIQEYQIRNNSLDSVYLERQFLQASRKIDQISEELEEFKAALFDEAECGIAAKQLYLNSSIEEDHINLKQLYKFFDANGRHTFLNKLSDYLLYAKKLESNDHPWVQRKSFAQKSVTDMSKLIKIIRQVTAANEDVKERTTKLLGHPVNWQEAELIINKKEALLKMLDYLESDSIYNYFNHIIKYPVKETNDLWLANTQRLIQECFDGLGPELSLDMDELGYFQEVLQKRMDAGKSPTKWFRWVMFSKDKGFLKRIMRKNKLKTNRDGLRKMMQKVDNRLNLEHNITKLYKADWIAFIPKTRILNDFNLWFEDYKLAVKAKRIFLSITNFTEYFPTAHLKLSSFKARLENLIGLLEDIPDTKLQWEVHLGQQQISDASGAEAAQRLITSLKEDFDSICAFDQLKESLEPYERDTIKVLRQEIESSSFDRLKKVFLNSINLEWIDHIETKFPILRQASTPVFESRIKELQENISKKLKLAQEIMLMRVREETFRDLEYNRLQNLTSFRDLKHQVNKKRRIWPLRKLIKNHREEMMQLIPCWLASPESVSAIFPMQKCFDLVIFDEASQCFVEKGIPAMYRADQVVIVGDQQQLPPNDLYKVRWEEEQPEEEHAALEIDSLLELAAHYLPQIQLRGHYRSKSIDLISFSNEHFYKGKLKMLPDYEQIKANKPAIQFVKLDGVWDKNANMAEAEYIIQCLQKIWHKNSQKEVGVVCFNATQQALIMDKAEEAIASGQLSIGKRFFVKNIENVQGDEVDIILFSIGYAPDKNNKMSMQFGSLNLPKGENRLNVAITRSREEVIVVSSIYPDQLNVNDTKNNGPKLLKAYLEYAKAVSEGKFHIPVSKELPYSKSWYLSHKLMTQFSMPHISLKADLPFADLTICKDGVPLALILTDDDLYYSSASIKEAHAYKPFMLKNKNWPFKAFTSRSYWRNADNIFEQITHFTHRIQDEQIDE